MDSSRNSSLFTAIVDYLEELFWVWVHRKLGYRLNDTYKFVVAVIIHVEIAITEAHTGSG